MITVATKLSCGKRRSQRVRQHRPLAPVHDALAASATAEIAARILGSSCRSNSQRQGQVDPAEEKAVDALDHGDRVEMVQRQRRLHLAPQRALGVGPDAVAGQGSETPRPGGGRKAALCSGARRTSSPPPLPRRRSPRRPRAGPGSRPRPDPGIRLMVLGDKPGGRTKHDSLPLAAPSTTRSRSPALECATASMTAKSRPQWPMTSAT